MSAVRVNLRLSRIAARPSRGGVPDDVLFEVIRTRQEGLESLHQRYKLLRNPGILLPRSRGDATQALHDGVAPSQLSLEVSRLLARGAAYSGCLWYSTVVHIAIGLCVDSMSGICETQHRMVSIDEIRLATMRLSVCVHIAQT